MFNYELSILIDKLFFAKFIKEEENKDQMTFFVLNSIEHFGENKVK
jgi:hypothetical protein